MRKMRSAVIGSLFVVVCVGCGTRLSQESEFEVPLEGKMFLVEPVGSEQKIKVSADAEGAPVNVFIYLQKDQESAERNILARRTTDVLAHELKATQVKLEATIPAKETAVVRVDRATAKGAKVILKITN